jgi:hypothetical protein
MTERFGIPLRPIGMRTGALVAAVAAAVLVAGCGDSGTPRTQPSPSTTTCRGDAPSVPLVRADLDGDGSPDEVEFDPPSGTCPGGLSSSVPGLRAAPTIDWDASGAARDAAVVRVPGRTGELVLLREQHPRGGFQAHLYGYADGSLAELSVDGKPVFPFVATDVLTDPISARCTDGGFEVLRARRHRPVGIVAAWDVFRTPYSVVGNTVEPGPTTKVADNVLDKDLATTYAELVRYSLFEDCLVAG